MSEELSYPCPQCQIGFLQPGRTPYIRIIRGMVVSVPEMPAHTCDLCGYQEFSGDALLMIESLVGHAGVDAPAPRPPLRLSAPETGQTHTLKP